MASSKRKASVLILMVGVLLASPAWLAASPAPAAQTSPALCAANPAADLVPAPEWMAYTCGACSDTCSGLNAQSACTSEAGYPGFCAVLFNPNGSHQLCPYGGRRCSCLEY